MLNMGCSSRIRNWLLLLFLLSWTTLSHSSSLPFIDSVKCARARISPCQACLFLCLMMSIIDSRCLPLRIIPERICSSSSLYIYVFVCVWPSVRLRLMIANMEVSMSLIKEEWINEWRLFCVQNSIFDPNYWPPMLRLSFTIV
jgi:hypothetical protein